MLELQIMIIFIFNIDQLNYYFFVESINCLFYKMSKMYKIFCPTNIPELKDINITML